MRSHEVETNCRLTKPNTASIILSCELVNIKSTTARRGQLGRCQSIEALLEQTTKQRKIYKSNRARTRN